MTSNGSVSTSLIGQTLGQYRILDELGAGGMGVVYKAQDIRLGRLVAVKVLPQATADDEEAIERFLREARTASSLNHPNICTIYSFDEHGGQLYLAMELLEGEPLDRKLAGKPLDLRTLLDLATQIADALDAAHAEGILHRDIKPANIFLTRRGQVKMLDFGLAKLAHELALPRSDVEPDRALLEHGGHHGRHRRRTCRRSRRAARTSIRGPTCSRSASCSTRWRPGRQSFPGATTAVVFDGILNREPMPPSTLNAQIPTEIDRIISKALEKDRALRYQSAADMRADLAAAEARLGIAARGRGWRVEQRIGRAVAAEQRRASHIRLPPTARPSCQLPASGTTVVTAAAAPTAVVPPRANRGSGRARGLSPKTIGAAAAVVVGLLAIAGVARMMMSPGAEPQVPTAQTDPNAAAPAVEPLAPLSAAPHRRWRRHAVCGAGNRGRARAATTAPLPANATSAATPTNAPAAAPAAAGAKPAAPAPAPVPAAPEPPKPDPAIAAANERLDVARAKIASNVLDPALGDLRQIVDGLPGIGRRRRRLIHDRRTAREAGAPGRCDGGARRVRQPLPVRQACARPAACVSPS